jgi:hypothetical protein
MIAGVGKGAEEVKLARRDRAQLRSPGLGKGVNDAARIGALDDRLRLGGQQREGKGQLGLEQRAPLVAELQPIAVGVEMQEDIAASRSVGAAELVQEQLCGGPRPARVADRKAAGPDPLDVDGGADGSDVLLCRRLHPRSPPAGRRPRLPGGLRQLPHVDRPVLRSRHQLEAVQLGRQMGAGDDHGAPQAARARSELCARRRDDTEVDGVRSLRDCGLDHLTGKGLALGAPVTRNTDGLGQLPPADQLDQPGDRSLDEIVGELDAWSPAKAGVRRDRRHQAQTKRPALPWAR